MPLIEKPFLLQLHAGILFPKHDGDYNHILTVSPGKRFRFVMNMFLCYLCRLNIHRSYSVAGKGAIVPPAQELKSCTEGGFFGCLQAT